MAKGEAEVYRPAEACRIAEVAPYVLRYWETEFAALSDGKDKGAAKVYTARDVRIISRIRELLYDEGFTVAGAKKRLDAEITEGRFDDGLAPAPPVSEQRKPAPAPAPKTEAPKAVSSAPPPSAKKPERAAPKTVADAPLWRASRESDDARPGARGPAASASDFDRKSTVRELKDIVRILDRSRAR